MDGAEAQPLLDEEMRRYRGFHRDLVQLVGSDTSVNVKGASGVEYVISIEIDYVNESDSGIEVVGVITESHGRRWLPAHVSASFTIQPETSPPRSGV